MMDTKRGDTMLSVTKLFVSQQILIQKTKELCSFKCVRLEFTQNIKLYESVLKFTFKNLTQPFVLELNLRKNLTGC